MISVAVNTCLNIAILNFGGFIFSFRSHWNNGHLKTAIKDDIHAKNHVYECSICQIYLCCIKNCIQVNKTKILFVDLFPIINKRINRVSVVVQWWRICLPVQETRGQSLLRDPYYRATKPVCHDHWACALQPGSCNCWVHVPQLQKPTHPKACAPHQEKRP